MSERAQVTTEAGDSVSWVSLDVASRAAVALHSHLLNAAETRFVSRAYLGEKLQKLVNEARNMGVDVK